MSNLNAQHQSILDTCEALKKVLADLPGQCPKSGHLQIIGNIQQNVQNVPEAKLPEVRRELEELIGQLKYLDAGDGEAILSARRWKKFMEWE
ncbi:MAG: hypothetical protein ACYDDI_00140 [Candidatus Acidiferrales bacterium]